MFKTVIKCFILISLFWVVYGFTIPNNEWYVTDKVGVFSETQKADLNTKIQEIEKSSSIEIAVLVVPTVDDDINLAAVDVGNQWGVGKKGQDNGLVLLIAVDDRKWSLQVGYGLEGTLPDLVTKQIGEARFPPNFRNGDYYQGILEMLDDVSWYIQQDPTIVQSYSQTSQSTIGNSFNERYLEFVFFFFIFSISVFGSLVTVASSTKNKKRKMKKYGRLMYMGGGIVLWLVVALVIPFVFAICVSYLFLLFSVLGSLYGRTSSWWTWIRYGGGGWSSFGGGWSSFGWFGGWSFGGGGSSWSR